MKYLMSDYSRARTILENIRVSNAILSRFDLVFLLLDDPDLQRDKKLSEHVMKLHSKNRKRKLEMFSSGLGGSDFGESIPGASAVKRLKTSATNSVCSQMLVDDEDEIKILFQSQSSFDGGAEV